MANNASRRTGQPPVHSKIENSARQAACFLSFYFEYTAARGQNLSLAVHNFNRAYPLELTNDVRKLAPTPTLAVALLLVNDFMQWRKGEGSYALEN